MSAERQNCLKNQPSNIELDGYKTGNEQTEFFSNARFMVMASRWCEGFPMSVLESAMYYKAAIEPDYGGFIEITAPERMQLVCSLNLKMQMREAVNKLWNDENLALELGQKAHLS